MDFCVNNTKPLFVPLAGKLDEVAPVSESPLSASIPPRVVLARTPMYARESVLMLVKNVLVAVKEVKFV